MEFLKNLTEKDFELLVDALDFLPHKAETGLLVGDMFAAALAPNPKFAESIMQKQKEKHEAKRRQLKDETDILKGKIILIKKEIYPHA